nr:uncharacterized protein CFP56_30095 [Quercus suber]
MHLHTTLALCAALTSNVIAHTYSSGRQHGDSTRPKVIMDNDWSTVGFIPVLQALHARWDILGLTSSTSNSWALQCGLHALATLEVGNLSCIPVYKGSDYPLINHPGLFQSWQDVHGDLPWQGAFATENLTSEAEGNDPTSGNPRRISSSAFKEGYPNTTFASDISAAEFMVQQVRKYPGEISIYAAGAMTNVALAVRLDSSFARNARELVVMGGYIDVNVLQTTGSILLADLQSDINLMIDPEASKIALTAAFPNITLAGNVANQVPSTQAFLDEIHEVINPYTDLIYNHYGTEFPFWDETAAAIMLDPSIVKNETMFYVDVDVSYASPRYGNIHAYQRALAPRAQRLREVKYVLEVDGEVLKRKIRESLQEPVAAGTSPEDSTSWPTMSTCEADADRYTFAGILASSVCRGGKVFACSSYSMNVCDQPQSCYGHHHNGTFVDEMVLNREESYSCRSATTRTPSDRHDSRHIAYPSGWRISRFRTWSPGGEHFARKAQLNSVRSSKDR